MVIFNRICIIYLNVFEYILYLRWYYSPMQTFASFMDFSQSMQFFLPLFPIFNFAFINISLFEHSMF